MAVRRLLHATGLRYRVSVRPEQSLRRTADIVFTRSKVAVFIDGCYWHGCPQHCHLTSSNYDYWSAKIKDNKTRDAITNSSLRLAGWTVLRYWEHESAQEVAARVIDVVRLNAGQS
jgi:DNA mismatch endonuclease (patch repair protein)